MPAKSGLRPSILHLYIKNLTTKIIELIAFLQGLQFVYPKRTDSRENSVSVSVTDRIQCARVFQRGNIRSQYQNKCSMVSGLLSQKNQSS